MSRFQGRVALVTGGAQGIGRAAVQRLSSEGAAVVLLDTDGELGSSTAAELSREGRQVTAVAADITRREEVRRAVEICVRDHGRLDVLVANAGIADAQPFLEIDDRRWHRVLDVNLHGTFHCVQEAARAMARAGRGSIVVTSSTNAFWVETNLAAYNTTKAAAIALVRSAAIDLAPKGIRVNAVQPGIVRTRLAAWVTENPREASAYLEKIPLNRFGACEDVANAIAFLASDEASYITGQTLILDGGLTLGLRLNLPEEPILG